MSSADTQQKLLIASGIAAAAVILTLIIVAKSQQEEAHELAHEQISRTAANSRSNPANVAKAERSQRTLDYGSKFHNTATPANSSPLDNASMGPTMSLNAPPKVDVAGAIPVGASVEEIITLLVLPNHEPNRRAIRELAQRGDAALVETLLQRLGEPDSPLERAVLETLGELRTPLALAPCRDALTSQHPELRRSAITALGKLESEAAAKTLRHHLDRGAVDDQRHTLEALGQLPYPGVGQKLLGYLHHPEPQLRRTAARSLTQLGDATVVQPVIDAIDHKDRFVRQELTKTLTNSRAPNALPTLRKLAQTDPDARVRGEAIRGLGDFGAGEDVELLERLLEDENAWIREQADEALGRIRR